MLPSRGVSVLRPAITLRSSVSGIRQTAPSWRVSSRQFSQARLFQSSQQWSNNSSALRGHTVQLPRLAVGSVLGSSSVLSQGAAASRPFSLWPFGSQQPTSIDTLPNESTTSSSTLHSSSSPQQQPAESSLTPPSETKPTFSEHAPSDLAQVSSSPQADPLSSSFDLNTYSDLDTNSILDIPEQIGYLKMLGLDFGWGPSSCVQWALEHTYVYTGMPWWAVVTSLTVAWRLILFYPTLQASKHAALLSGLRKNPEFRAVEAEMWEANATRNLAAVSAARAKMSYMQKRTGASTLKSFLPFAIMIPFSFGAFRVMRAMSAIPVPSLETGGFAWFTDLTVHDPYFILPLATAALSVLSLRQNQKASHQTPQMAAMGKFMLFGLTPIMFLCTGWLPALLQWFFFCFGAGQLIQTAVTLNPAVRRWADMPALPKKPMLPPTKGVSIPGKAGALYQAPSIKKNLQGMMKSVKEATEQTTSRFTGGSATTRRQKAQNYEKRRAEEEEQRKLEREDEHRRRKMLKGRK